MSNIDRAFRVNKGLSLKGLTGIFTLEQNPQSVGFEAPVGSIVLQSNGVLWTKTNTGDNDWSKYTQLNDLSDVSISGAVTNQALVYNGTSFSNTTLTLAMTTGNLPLSRGGLNADISTFDGVLNISSGVASYIKNNYTATSNPTASDDASENYSVGSRWINTSSGEEYVCVDNTTDSAIWANNSINENLSEAVNGIFGLKNYQQGFKRSNGIILPLYIYPTDPVNNVDYNTVIDLAKQYRDVPTIVAINPSNGPGTVVDGNYSAAVDRLVGAEITVIGYVSSAYMATDLATVKADCAKWRELYPAVRGIWVDEMPNGYGVQTVPDIIAYYNELYNYCKETLNFDYVYTNPGSTFDKAIWDGAVADNITFYETDGYPLESELNVGSTYYDSMFEIPIHAKSVLAHTISSWDSASVDLMIKYAGWIFITDDIMPNPYDALTPYLEQMYQHIYNANIAISTNSYGSIQGDTGSATAETAGSIFKVAGTGPISTSVTNGSPDTITISLANLEVQYGGTGKTSFTANSLLLGNTTSAVAEVSPGTDGQILIAATGAAPAFATVTDGSGITTSTGANSLTISVNSYVLKTNGTYTLALPATDGTAGYALATDGLGQLSWVNVSPHDPVTLDTTLNSNLLSLTGQQLALDSQTQNLVFASPDLATGVPSFRSLVINDLPSTLVLTDGSRGFTNPVTGIDPTASNHLVTKSYADTLFAGTKDYQESVLSRTNGGPPALPSSGDRYIVDSATGDWSAFAVNDIVEYDTSWSLSLDVSDPTSEGAITWVEDESKQIVYTSTSWVTLTSTMAHNSMSGLQGNGTDYYHLDSTEYAALHGAVTLDTNADTILSLSAQQIGLDTQNANLVFAGPTTGGAAVPTFRSLVTADIPDIGSIYLKIDGTNAMAANLNVNSNQVVNVAAIAGTDSTVLSNTVTFDMVTTGEDHYIRQARDNGVGGSSHMVYDEGYVWENTGVVRLDKYAGILGDGDTNDPGAFYYASKLQTGDYYIEVSATKNFSASKAGIEAWYFASGGALRLKVQSDDITGTGNRYIGVDTDGYLQTMTTPLLATDIGVSVQAYDSDLSAIAGLSTTGLIVRTGTGTATTRSVTGTTDRISVTNGDGVSGAPTIDIAGTYVGQTSITTLGTISTGTWNGSTIGVAYGGTGFTTINEGELLYGFFGGGAIGKLSPGSAGQVLVMGGSNVPIWGSTLFTLTADSGTNQSIQYGNTLDIEGGTGISTVVGATDKVTISIDSSVLTTSSIGVSVQAYDADLSAIAALTTTGLVVRTGAGTATTRSVTGTADRISVTNGDGVAGAPTIDIAATYVGQTSITTLGTIATGTWNATAIGATKGGTGLTGYAAGDLIYASALNTLSALTIGAEGYVLTVSAGVPVWSAAGATYSFTAAGSTGTPQTISNGDTLTIAGGTGIDTSAGVTDTITISIDSSVLTTSSIGVSVQAYDADLGAVAALATTGLVVRTGAGTATTRAVTGTADRIAVTNGDGVAGAPTIDIAATYVGQTSITTLGTIATGTWNATAISAVKGGTGLTTYTTGDLIYASATNTLSKLAVGTNGQVLTLAAGVPSWADPTGSSGTEHYAVQFKYPGSIGGTVQLRLGDSITNTLAYHVPTDFTTVKVLGISFTCHSGSVSQAASAYVELYESTFDTTAALGRGSQRTVGTGTIKNSSNKTVLVSAGAEGAKYYRSAYIDLRGGSEISLTTDTLLFCDFVPGFWSVSDVVVEVHLEIT